jgi:acetyl/propionyl-CoA carboxylase alpha subunit
VFTSVLVANRGEIAVRIIRTLRRMGVRSVLAASVPDRRSLAARSADELVVLEGYSAQETYLDIDLVIAAAKDTGCDAIHPGYGSLSERPEFAERCARQGIVFVGPPPEVLRALGDKSAARELAIAAGVPVVPGYDGPDDDQSLASAAAEIGFPVMVKARGGGGGRGMREVHGPADLLEAVTSARREAESAFGDPRLLLEKLVTRAHHVEVQVLADSHGNLVHLGERDCSVQRRRQKLIEESPSPVVDDALRERLTTASLRLARAANYVNAGTVEFLVGRPDERGERPFYFLEVNPRLQVEHPVTEMRTGLDLVELQLRIAAGEALPFAQKDLKFEGHAIEFRINAEDPWDGFKPSTGRIEWLSQASGRYDWGFEGGDVVSLHYDSLVGKAIFHGPSREANLDKVDDEGLGGVTLAGRGDTNVALLSEVAKHPDFAGGRVTIDWLDNELASIQAKAEPPLGAFVAAALSGYGPVATPVAVSARGALPRPRGLRSTGPIDVWVSEGGRSRAVRLAGDPRSGTATVEGRSLVYSARSGRFVVDGIEFLSFARAGTRLPWVRVEEVVVGPEGAARSWSFDLVPPPPLPRRAQAAAAGATVITAPLAGTIAGVRVAEGDAVEAGQLLVLLEAMKMEHRIVAPGSGSVARIAVQQGDVVREGDLLVELV